MKPGQYGWMGAGRIATEPWQDDRRSLQDAVIQLEPVNGRPAPVPYRYRGDPAWEPASVTLYASDSIARAAERREWARANAKLVAAIRARLEM